MTTKPTEPPLCPHAPPGDQCQPQDCTGECRPEYKHGYRIGRRDGLINAVLIVFVGSAIGKVLAWLI